MKSNNSEITFDLNQFFSLLFTQWKTIFLFVGLSFSVGVFYLHSSPTIYSVDALVQIEDGKGTSVALMGDLSEFVDQKSQTQAEIEILRSRIILEQIIYELNLDIKVSSNESEFNKFFRSTTKDKVTYQKEEVNFYNKNHSFSIKKFDIPKQYLDKNLTLVFNKKNFQLMLDKKLLFTGVLNKRNFLTKLNETWNVSIFSAMPLSETYKIKKLSLSTAIADVNKNYTVSEKVKQTGIISLQYQGVDKEHITTVLNTIMTAYGKQNIIRNSAESAQTLDFLKSQLPKIKHELNVAENKFNLFREKNNTIDITQESSIFLKKSLDIQSKKIELETKRAELYVKYNSYHPFINEIDVQLAAINQQNNELQSILTRLPELQREYLQLYRDVEVQSQLYTTLLNNYQKLQVVKAGEIGSVRVINRAIEPISPIKPNKVMILVISLLVGGFLGVFCVLVRQIFFIGIQKPEQIESSYLLPVYVTIPYSHIQNKNEKKRRNELLAVTNENDVVISNLHSVAAMLYFNFPKEPNKIIHISSPKRKSGKSIIISNLSVILASSGKRVLVVDADMRNGNLHNSFNVEIQKGLADYLSSNIEISEIIQNTLEENLNFISHGNTSENPSKLLLSEKLKVFIDDISIQYDFILIESPPILDSTDSIIISKYSAMNIIVLSYKKTKLKEVDFALNRFTQVGSKVNGFILNEPQRPLII